MKTFTEWLKFIRKMGHWRILQTAVLLCAGTISLPVFLWRGDGKDNPPIQKWQILSVFPYPLVFTKPVYLYKRQVTFSLASHRQITLDQSDIIRRGYHYNHRLAGVALWHFLKYSPMLKDSFINEGLQVFFCEDGSRLDIINSEKPTSIGYIIRSPQGSQRRIDHKCEP